MFTSTESVREIVAFSHFPYFFRVLCKAANSEKNIVTGLTLQGVKALLRRREVPTQKTAIAILFLKFPR